MAGKSKQLTKHMLTGVSYMIPVICLGGILQSFGTMLGGSGVAQAQGTIAYTLYNGGSLAMSMVVPVLAAYISFSICDRPGIAPGLLIGLLSVNYKIGFVGGIIGGYLVGYVCKLIKEKFPISNNLQSLMPLLIIPILGGLFAILIMDYILGPVLGGFQAKMIELFSTMQTGSKVMFGLVLGVLMGVDLGGPITKIGTTVANGLVADGVLGPEGAKVCIGIVAPLALGISSSFISKRKYTNVEQATGKSAMILGCCQVGEGGLPFLLRDPLHVMPCTIVGSAVTGALAMYFDVGSSVMMGGFFAFPVMQNVFPGAFIAVGAGVIVTILLLALFKKDVQGDEEEMEIRDENFDVRIEFE